MGTPPGGHRRRRRLGPRLPARAGDGRPALPAAGRRRHRALRWRAPPGRAVQAAAAEARPAAARRAHQPPRRRERAVARAAPREVRRRRRRRHPRPVLPGQRRRSGSSSSTAAAPTPTRATTRPTWRRRQTRSRSRARRTPSWPSGSRTSSSGCGPTPRAGRPSRKARLARYEEMAAEADRTRKLDFEEIQIPPGPRLGSVGHRGQRTSPRASATGCSSTTCRSRCRATASSASSAPTASARPRCSRRIVGLEEPDGGAVKIGETVKISYVDQSRGGLDPKKNLWETVSDGPRLHQGRPGRDPVARLRRRSSASRAPTSRSRPACSPAASATGSTWR